MPANNSIIGRLDRAVVKATEARKAAEGCKDTSADQGEQQQATTGWTPAQEQALRDALDAAYVLLGDLNGAIIQMELDLTQCLIDQTV